MSAAAPRPRGASSSCCSSVCSPAHLEVRDDSAAHAGHASAGGKGHFRLRIVSTCFAGLKPLQRHRLVNEVLSPLFATEVHALAMETLTPDEVSK